MAEQALEYPQLAPWALEPHYSRHMTAMTREALHDKSAIAEQLAWRDMQLAAIGRIVLRALASGQLEKLEDARRYLTGADTIEAHCPTCICGRRAPVMANHRIPRGEPGHGPGTITWHEYLLAYQNYSNRFGDRQSAERMAERGGLCYAELTDHLGHAPKTWEPCR